MNVTNRYAKFNMKKPVLSFRVDPDLKEIVRDFAEMNDFITKRTGKPNIEKALYHIVHEYLKYESLL